MAVVQISRIQVRRGQKNQGSGVPQLSGGEFGWAVDSRELYIGNGSVAEGAPAVGNTKIITEHDDLFTLANTYTYLEGQTAQTGVPPPEGQAGSCGSTLYFLPSCRANPEWLCHLVVQSRQAS